MAIAQPYYGTGTISTTEYSLPNQGAYSSANDIATTGIYQIFIDVSNMASGDQFQFKVYNETIPDLSVELPRVIYQVDLVGPQSPPVLIFPSMVLMNGWDVTAKKIAGTDRILSWSIRSVS